MRKTAKTICVTHLKGGVSKTTTTYNTCCYLASKGYKVLAIDLDPQSNLTTLMNSNREHNIFDVFESKVIEPKIIEKIKPNLDLIGCSMRCATLDLYILNQMCRELILKTALQPLKEKYDYIFFDSPPALNYVVLNAVTCSDYILMPYEPDVFCFEGLIQVNNYMTEVIKKTNENLKFIGIVLTKFNPKRKVSKTAIDQLVNNGYGDLIFDSKIGISTVISQANNANQSIFEFAPNSSICQDYTHFCDELLKKLGDE